MKALLYFCLDLINYSLLGILLVYLFKDMLPDRFLWKQRIKMSWLMCLQYVAVRQVVSYSDWAKRIIYGDDMHIISSKQSIVPVAVSMFVTLFVGFLLYKGSRMKLLSLTAAFYALLELSRFLFYPIVVKSINSVMDYYNHLYWDLGKITVETYQQSVERAEIIWNLVSVTLIFALQMCCIVLYKRYLVSGERAGGEISYSMYQKTKMTYKPQEAAILFVPELLGLVFVIMLRSILFYYEEEVFFLIENYPELNLMIPFLSLLCIVSILLSAKMLAEIEKEHEKRHQMELYQSKAEELEAHVKDMESVHIQIRGMKHDMKNYIADINALLAQMASGDRQAAEEVRHYIDSMQSSLDGLDRKYQTKNPVTDVILGRYVRLAEQQNIAFSVDFIYPANLGIDVFDISVILNNGLDNAFEACEKELVQPFVTLSASQKGKMFLITIENSFSGTLKWEGMRPVSTKSDGSHGFGLRNIQNCAEKYYGRVEIQTEENRYCLTVMLQGCKNI